MLHKGKRLSASSPLSPETKRFFLGFSDSSEEHVLDNRHLSKDQSALNTVIQEGIKPPDRSALQAHWADPLRVEHDDSRSFSWWHVALATSSAGTAQARPDGWPKTPPAWDHHSIWTRDGAPVIAVSQPYPWMLNRDLSLLDDFSHTSGLRLRVSNYPAWHFPGRCWFIEWHAVTA